MPDYNKGKIYKIVSPNSDKIYIGSTIRPLKERFWAHMSNWRNGKNRHSTIGAYIATVMSFVFN